MADEARTSGADEEDAQFPSLVDLFVRHGRSIEVAEVLICGIKERTKEELEPWGLGRIRLRCSMSLEEPLFEMDDREEAEKWEHIEEL